MPPMNLEANAKVPGNLWGRGGYNGAKAKKVGNEPAMSDIWPGANENVVVISRNEHLSGCLDKAQFGASAFGLVHSCYELYGPTVAGQLLSVLGRLFVTYMQAFHGFTCGIDDLMLKPDAEKQRRLLLYAANDQASKVTRQVVSQGNPSDEEAVRNGMSEARRNPDKAAELNGKVKGAVSSIASRVIENCLPDGTIKPFPRNCMQLMTGSGARGSNVNASQISCLLGQQELEGKRVPVMLSGRTLPSFSRYDPSARAGGFIMDRFLTGIRPQEYYFHCMAGREGLIDTAVKTSTSGYLQHTLIKSLESLVVEYDYTVRDSDGSVVQFAYGEDALDVTRTAYLNRFKFWASNFDALVTRYNVKSAAEKFSGKDIKEVSRVIEASLRDPEHTDAVLSRYFPSEKIGVMSEKFYGALMDYMAADPDGFFASKQVSRKRFHGLMCLRYARALVDPGESVGLLASQSIGEPSTQMTLNTFHLAGRGDVNVTLGMPRLRELLMFAKQNIATPTMTLTTFSGTQEDATHVARALSRLTLLDVVEDVTLSESLTYEPSKDERLRKYEVRITFKPDADKTLEDYGVATALKKHMQVLKQMIREAVAKETKIKERDISSSASIGFEKSRETAAASDDDDDSSDNEAESSKKKEANKSKKKKDKKREDMEDADEEDQINKKKEKGYYEGPEDDEDNEELKEDDSNDESSDSESKSKKKTEDTREDVVMEEEEDDDDDDSGSKNEGRTSSFTISVPSDKKVLMMQLVERCIEKTVLSECSHIRRCYVSSEGKGKDQKYVVRTEGVNFSVLQKLDDIIDINNVYSNDVYAILTYYGVEAARKALVNEVGSVFKAYGINVNPRHLSLIADYMTFTGGYRSLNRTGIDTSVSPLLKISFETTSEFLTRAALYREIDTMSTPSSCIIVGKPIHVGTGICELRQVVDPQRDAGADDAAILPVEATEAISSAPVTEKEESVEDVDMVKKEESYGSAKKVVKDEADEDNADVKKEHKKKKDKKRKHNKEEVEEEVEDN